MTGKSFQTPPAVFGTRQISIIPAGKEIHTGIVYSNDGLIFVTYDHYFTFYEIK